eukprot:Rmarinus@m.11517
MMVHQQYTLLRRLTLRSSSKIPTVLADSFSHAYGSEVASMQDTESSVCNLPAEPGKPSPGSTAHPYLATSVGTEDRGPARVPRRRPKRGDSLNAHRRHSTPSGCTATEGGRPRFSSPPISTRHAVQSTKTSLMLE